MILYSIRKKSTEKYFIHFHGRLISTWCVTPQFSMKPDTIWKNLKRLCSEGYWEEYKIGNLSGTFKRKNWRKFDKRKLELYEVVQFNVRVLGAKATSAEKFVIPKTIAKLNVRIK